MPLPLDTLVVVGDKFESFASLEGAMTVSRFATELDHAGPGDPMPSQVVVGQGVSDSWLAYIEARAAERGAGIAFHGEGRVAERPGRHVCHKWQRRNVLVTRPRKLGPTHFGMQMSIDDDCEIMSDHVTGYHVQGMLLVEAARQSFLAVSECYLLDASEGHYFVIDSFNFDFERFVFPVRVDIDFRLTSLDRSRPDRLKAQAVIDFMHCGERACRCEVSFSAILDSRLRPKEEAMARHALAHTLSAHAQPSRLEATAAD